MDAAGLGSRALITLTRNCRIGATKLERVSEVGDDVIARNGGQPTFWWRAVWSVPCMIHCGRTKATCFS